MSSENVRYYAFEDTTTNITTNKRSNLIAFDTTKDSMVYYKEDGTTLRTLLTLDSSYNSLYALGNVLIGDGKYFGLASDKGRIVFTDSAVDTIGILSARVGVGKTPTVLLDLEDAQYPWVYLKTSSAGDFHSEFRMTNYENDTLIISKYNSGAEGTLFGVALSNLSLISSSPSGSGGNLMISQSSTGSIFFVSNGQISMTIDDDYRVGIGTVSPVSKLTVYNDVITVESATGDTSEDILKGSISGGSLPILKLKDIDEGASKASIVLETRTTTDALKITDAGAVSIAKGLAVTDYTKLGGTEFLKILTIAHTLTAGEASAHSFTETVSLDITKVRGIFCTGTNGSYSTATPDTSNVYSSWAETTATTLTVRVGNSFAENDIISTTIILAA